MGGGTHIAFGGQHGIDGVPLAVGRQQSIGGLVLVPLAATGGQQTIAVLDPEAGVRQHGITAVLDDASGQQRIAVLVEAGGQQAMIAVPDASGGQQRITMVELAASGQQRIAIAEPAATGGQHGRTTGVGGGQQVIVAPSGQTIADVAAPALGTPVPVPTVASSSAAPIAASAARATARRDAFITCVFMVPPVR